MRRGSSRGLALARCLASRHPRLGRLLNSCRVSLPGPQADGPWYPGFHWADTRPGILVLAIPATTHAHIFFYLAAAGTQSFICSSALPHLRLNTHPPPFLLCPVVLVHLVDEREEPSPGMYQRCTGGDVTTSGHVPAAIITQIALGTRGELGGACNMCRSDHIFGFT